MKKVAIHKSHGGMDFRNLEDFNIALLAKIAWRLINQPQAFWAEVFKGRYFLNCNLLQLSKGNNYS